MLRQMIILRLFITRKITRIERIAEKQHSFRFGLLVQFPSPPPHQNSPIYRDSSVYRAVLLYINSVNFTVFSVNVTADFPIFYRAISHGISHGIRQKEKAPRMNRRAFVFSYNCSSRSPLQIWSSISIVIFACLRLTQPFFSASLMIAG